MFQAEVCSGWPGCPYPLVSGRLDGLPVQIFDVSKKPFGAIRPTSSQEVDPAHLTRWLGLIRAAREKHPSAGPPLYLNPGKAGLSPSWVHALAASMTTSGPVRWAAIRVRVLDLGAFLEPALPSEHPIDQLPHDSGPFSAQVEGGNPASPFVNHGLIQAYRRLGMCEMVLDAEPWQSLTRSLAGASVLEAVLAAFDRRHLRTRALIEGREQVLPIEDQAALFFTLFRLAVRFRGFRADFGTNGRIEPSSDHLALSKPLADLRHNLPWPVLAENRLDPSGARRFWEETLLARWRLIDHLCRLFRGFTLEPPSVQEVLVRVAHAMRQGEEAAADFLIPWQEYFRWGRELERRIRNRFEGLLRLLHTLGPRGQPSQA
jgi:hypothetical protein